MRISKRKLFLEILPPVVKTAYLGAYVVDLKLAVIVQGQFQFIVETWKYRQKTGKVNFLMNVLATLGQLRTERSLERKNWLQHPLWNLKNGTSVCALATFQYVIDP
jgi:hypothetical protein